MARASLQSRGRFLSPALGVLLLGGVLVIAAVPGAAQNPGKGGAAKAPVKPAPVPEPLKLTIVAADPSKPEELAQTTEMVKFINEKLEAGWKANNVTPSRHADDYEFIRRASLDIIGRIATPKEIEAFLKNPPDKRRSMLINELLASDEYPLHWADMWTNWLLSRSGPFGRGTYHTQMAGWLKDQFALNAPYSEIVKQLITAKGKNTENGAVNFVLAHVGEQVPPPRRKDLGHFEMVPLTSRVTRLFLGTQVQCAQCHDHPFRNAIKQNHFWGINVFLRQVDRDGTPPPMRNMNNAPALTLLDRTDINPDATVFYEKRNGVILETAGEFLPQGKDKHGGKLPEVGKGQTVGRRRELAEFLVGHEMFPKAIVNRTWSVFFGRGFVNPIDDFNDQNPPSNPELLEELAARFKHYNYDTKKLIRWICNSNAYNLSYEANKTNDKAEQEVLFSRMLLKSMSPEQLFESLMTATNAEAAETKDGKKELRNRWLDRLVGGFGDDEGNEVNFNGTIVQALLMMNGEDINNAITRKDKSTVALAMAGGHAPRAVITELYLASLNRKPTEKEIARILEQFTLQPRFQANDAKNPAARYQDLFWALLNSSEFLLNH
jgi:hypothetical protein